MKTNALSLPGTAHLVLFTLSESEHKSNMGKFNDTKS